MDSQKKAESVSADESLPQNTGVNFPKAEEALVKFWNTNSIYDKAMALRRKNNAGTFVFYEGPPTANGLPHPGHCLTRAIKDLYPRYKSMKGFLCERRAGWDTHGLPVEVEVCKELKIHSKEQIEEYGVEPFVHRCVENVFRYTKQWEELTQRIGFWINLDKAYVTFHKSYVESVWWALKSLFDRGLLYQGYKIIWWWAQGGTALSSGEVGQGYREVADPSVFVRFPVVNDRKDPRFDNVDLLVWTTTPWTLLSNQFAAVHPELEYSIVTLVDADGNEDPRKLVIASALVETVVAKAKKTAKVVSVLKGSELVSLRYIPPFDCYYKTLGDRKGTLCSGGEEHIAWRVCAADFVTTDSGTGLVHEAPAFGEVDFDVLAQEQTRFVAGQGPELICAVAPNGNFTADFPEFQGRWVKDCDREIIRILRDRGTLFLQEQYVHEYPFCWRATKDPLIQYPRRSWFIRTTSIRDDMLANNEKINWLPEHIKHGRFGNFLATNVDWALSRERYWGTPLPIWVCEETGYMEAISSYDELLAKPGIEGQMVWQRAHDAAKQEAGANWNDEQEKLWEHLKVHKPYIDAMTYQSPKAPGKRMRRVPEVIDCWFDSGSMPFAQVGYPHVAGSQEEFAKNFPADFISEAIDQTRGWFYSQVAISTLLFSDRKEYPHPFRNCIVLGLMLGEDGQKMSKSLRNYREPREIFDKYGADALRWYFYANQTPWTSIRYSEPAIKDSMPEFLIRLWNVCSFFEVYRNIDHFDPKAVIDAKTLAAAGGKLDASLFHDSRPGTVPLRPVCKRSELDRWILSELNDTIAVVTERMDAYDHFAACARITALVDSLSNWYVRRSRDRFWSSQETFDKADAYWTLYETLLVLARLIAPFTPFMAERMWQQLAVGLFGDAAAESVHLTDYPVADASLIDRHLNAKMNAVREIVSLGRNARMGAKLKVRQPLAGVKVVLTDASLLEDMVGQTQLMAEELNVKKIEFIDRADEYITYSVLPNFKLLGKKLGALMPKVKAALAGANAAKLLHEKESTGKIILSVEGTQVELNSEEVEIRIQARQGFAAAQGPDCVVVLSTELTPELLAEGRARELVRLIQDRRKEMNCQYTDRILVGIKTNSEAIGTTLAAFGDYIKGETLALSLDDNDGDGEWLSAKIEGEPLEYRVVVK